VEWSAWEPNSTWTVSAIFAPENLGRVRQAIEEEVAKALSEGFTAEEVEAARKGLLALRRLGRAQDAQLAAALAENLRLGRRFEVSQAVDDRIARLTPEDVHAALCRHLRPDRWVWAVGGDFKD
jgi:zinc protease